MSSNDYIIGKDAYVTIMDRCKLAIEYTTDIIAETNLTDEQLFKFIETWNERVNTDGWWAKVKNLLCDDGHLNHRIDVDEVPRIAINEVLCNSVYGGKYVRRLHVYREYLRMFEGRELDDDTYKTMHDAAYDLPGLLKIKRIIKSTHECGHSVVIQDWNLTNLMEKYFED